MGMDGKKMIEYENKAGTLNSKIKKDDL